MTVHLIRHASAGRRSFGPGGGHSDLERPLDAFGLDQAALIAERLSDAGIEEVHTSAATRCQQTIEPLARALGLPLTVAPSLLEGSSIASSMDFIRSFGHRTVALCSHGDVIPEVIRTLEVGGTRIVGERGFAKGSIWTLTLDDDGRFDRATYSPIPAL